MPIFFLPLFTRFTPPKLNKVGLPVKNLNNPLRPPHSFAIPASSFGRDRAKPHGMIFLALSLKMDYSCIVVYDLLDHNTHIVE